MTTSGLLAVVSVLGWRSSVPRLRPSAAARSPVIAASETAAPPITANRAALAAAPAFPRTWVPIASTWELDPDRPTPVGFLGQRYVAYRDNQGQWVVMDDACPHRLAPLSEGRIDREHDRIECAYHGWAFDKSGACARIPQASDELAATAEPSKRACVASYPTQVVCSVLWVWPWPESSLSVAGVPHAHPEAMLEGVDPDASTYTRDLPYGWDTLLENIVDPAHIPFAHHGLQGKRDDAIPINMTNPEMLGERGVTFEFGDRTMGMRRAGTAEFRAPFVVKYNASFEPKTAPPPKRAGAPPPPAPPPRPNFQLTVICVPTAPGWSRAIIFGGIQPNARKQRDAQAARAAKEARARARSGEIEGAHARATSAAPAPRKSLASRIFGLLPVWLVHLGSNRFLDSDLAFLHYQEQVVRSRGGSAVQSYFLPAPADRCIVAVRKWIAQYAHVPGPLPPPLQTRAALFDRWTQHTSHCVHCQAAYKALLTWRRNAYAALAAAALGFQWWPARLLGVACLVLLRVLAALEGAFKENDYKHYLNQ